MDNLRKKLLNWHRGKQGSLTIVDLLASDYQTFRNRVNVRLNKNLDFRDAIKEANDSELSYLDMHILEEKLEKRKK